MNPTATDPLAPPPPPLPSQPPRSSFSCDRHTEEQFSGFCPLCLCERLTTLDISNNNNNPSSSSRRPSTSSSAAAAIKSLFSLKPPKPSNKPSSSSFVPELRRTKSFSASKHEGLFGLNFSGSFEPQRKSCDVRGRSTLWSLFSQDDESKNPSSGKPSTSSAKDIGDNFVNEPVLELKEEDDDDEEEEEPDIQVMEEIQAEERGDINLEIVGEEEKEEGLDLSRMKPMKDHIDLDSQAKKSYSGGGRELREIAGSFWSAASVFSKKWNYWRRKQKLEKRGNGENSGATLPVEKPISRKYRETQSEIADYGFGRRSCDTDPRFSLDAGRMSFDDPRYSFDEPRASWDGYLVGRSFPRMMPMPPMVSLVEDAPVVAHVPRSDTMIPVEEEPAVLMNVEDENNVPGGSAQTREYYLDASSSSRRRKSLDRSNSIRKTAAAVVAEIDELKSVSNAKVLPSSTIDCVNGTKVLVGGEKDIRDSNSNSLRDDCSETLELGGGFRDNASVVGGNGEHKGSSKKSRRWSWKLWGFIHRRSGGNKDEDEDRYSRANGVERSLSESWSELRRDSNGEVRGGLNRKVFRSNSSVSWRHSNNMGVSFGRVRNLGMDMNGKKKRDEFILERNRSARYSPNNVDNGLLRLYLTPMRSGRRGAVAKTRPNNAHSIARSVLRLY